MKVELTAEERAWEELRLEEIEEEVAHWDMATSPVHAIRYRDLLRKLLDGKASDVAGEAVWLSDWPRRAVHSEVRETVYWKFPIAGTEWVCALNWSKDFGYRVRIEYGVRTDGPFGVSDPQADDLRLAQDAEHFWEALRASVPWRNQALLARIDGWEAVCQG